MEAEEVNRSQLKALDIYPAMEFGQCLPWQIIEALRSPWILITSS